MNKKQTPYEIIYALNPVELEILNVYIEIYLKTRFIWSSKSFTSAFIWFDKKFDRSFWLCVNY